jgi:hypothetical protein
VTALPDLIMSLNSARITITPPRTLTMGAVLVICAYGLVLFIPVLFAMVVVSVLPLGMGTLLIPLLAVGFATFFLPVGFGNPYVVRLIRSLNHGSVTEPGGFMVQLTLAPRVRSGLRALLEDADDVGWLRLKESGLLFQGDSITLSVPYDQIRQLKTENLGWRGLFVYGSPSVFAVPGLPEATGFKFAERSSWLLPSSRRNACRLHRALADKIAASNPSEEAASLAAKRESGS